MFGSDHSKASLPLMTVLLAGVVHNTACFLVAVQFYEALLNWAISVHSQETHRTVVFVLLEEFVLGGGRCAVGACRSFCGGQAEGPWLLALSESSCHSLGEAGSHRRCRHICVNSPPVSGVYQTLSE